MRKSSINIANIKTEAYEHNHRNYTPKYAIDTADKNEYISFLNDKYLKTETNKFGTYKKIDFKAIEELYRVKHKETTGRTPQASIKWFKEAVINTDEHITKEHLINLKNKLKKEFGISVIDIAHHKDEGHIDDGVKKINYHAHLIFVNANDSGITKKWNKSELSRLQTVVAETLEMERGILGGKNRRLEHKDYKEQQKIKTKAVNKAVENIEEQHIEDMRIIKIMRNEIIELKTKNKELTKTNNENFDKLSDIQQLFNALGLSEISVFVDIDKETIKKAKAIIEEKYKQERENLKASNVAMQQDYKNLKIEKEKNVEIINSYSKNKKNSDIEIN
jgi:hypothetical protein